jgi:hypothetical protein
MPLPKLEHAASEERVQVEPRSVFLNLPYDIKFHRLFLAYIAGVVSFGLKPRVALEVPGGVGRISRIITLIRACPYSFHDLSRVEVDISYPSFSTCIANGTVLNTPIASKAHPAPLRVSPLSLSAMSKPMPSPRATRVPPINMISGILSFFLS